MKTWGLFVISFGLFLIMVAPLYNTTSTMLLSGLVFVVVGILMYRKGRNKE